MKTEWEYQNHWSERGRATSVANSGALGRPHRSVLALAERAMTEQEAIAVAEEYVRQRGSRLCPEVRALPRKRFLRRTRFWQVVSGYPIKGGNWFIAVDDSSGKVMAAKEYKR